MSYLPEALHFLRVKSLISLDNWISIVVKAIIMQVMAALLPNLQAASFDNYS